MKLFITAIPLFSMDMAVEAYKLEFQNANALFGMADSYTALDGAMNSPGIELVARVGVAPFAHDKPLFVNVSKFMLLMGLEDAIKPEQLVCILTDDFPMEPMYLDKCVELKEKGYQLALQNIDYGEETKPLFEMASYVVLDLLNPESAKKLKTVRQNVSGVKAVFLNVDSLETFDAIKNINFALFQGKFYNEPVTKGQHKISPLKANALHLIKLAGEPDFNLPEVSTVIEHDPALSLALLRFINSPAIGVRERVSSIRHAVALLGQKETAKWITVATSKYLGDDKPSEITRLSLIRAKFAENMAVAFGLPAQSASLFLMGLFSLIDVILDKTMEQAVAEISVTPEIREALVEGKGPLYKVLEMIKYYEHADWQNVTYNLVLNKARGANIGQAYIGALIWYKQLLIEAE